MTTTFLLVHSPVVGPATWRLVADELAARAIAAAVPELTPPLEAPRPWWSTAANEVVAAVAATVGGQRIDVESPPPGTGSNVVLVGHSGTGSRLPAIGERLAAAGHPVVANLFVDAGLPSSGGSAGKAKPAQFAELLDGLVDDDGLLPPWPQWWSPGTMVDLVPDPAVRAAVAAECPPVPRSLFDEVVPVPSGWPGATPCGYLAFGYGYEDEAAEAERRGWVVARMDGLHLHPVVAPADVADALQLLVAALEVRF